MEDSVAGEQVNDQWIKLFYSRIDSNLSTTRQSLHATHQWVLTLSIALITAIFSIPSRNDRFPNYLGLMILIVSFPILLRFFIRSCLEYSIEEKFITLRNEIDYYLIFATKSNDKKLKKRLVSCIQYYYYDWLCPRKLTKIVWHNLKLSYLWIFLLYVGLVIWGIVSVVGDLPMFIIGGFSAIIVVLEIFMFITYKGFKYHEWHEYSSRNQ